jgi:hypothetical protein
VVSVRLHVHPGRIIGRLRPHAAETDPDLPVDDDVAERELLEGHFDDWKADVYSAAGNGSVAASMPEATPREIYREFEHDEEPPADPAG